MSAVSKREIEVLRAVYECRDRPALCNAKVSPGWARPQDCGGRDGSHHSATLRRLFGRGLVERDDRGGWTRPSYQYRVTQQGVELIERLTASRGDKEGG